MKTDEMVETPAVEAEASIPDVARQYVFASLEEANLAVPEDNRYRLYTVAGPDGKVLFCWERNPVVAIGRCCKDWGFKAEPHTRVMTSGEIVASFQSLAAEEKEAIIAQLQGSLPGGRKHRQ